MINRYIRVVELSFVGFCFSICFGRCCIMIVWSLLAERPAISPPQLPRPSWSFVWHLRYLGWVGTPITGCVKGKMPKNNMCPMAFYYPNIVEFTYNNCSLENPLVIQCRSWICKFRGAVWAVGDEETVKSASHLLNSTLPGWFCQDISIYCHVLGKLSS